MPYTSRTGPRTYDPRTPEPGGYDPWSPKNYVSPYTLVNVTYRPDFFAAEVVKYNAKPTDRKLWLQDQIKKLETSANQYIAAVQSTYQVAATLDGKSDVGKWLTTIGGVAITTSNPIGVIGGAAMVLFGTIANAIEKRSDLASAKELGARFKTLQAEFEQIKKYYNDYTTELKIMQYSPLALFGLSAYLIYTQ